MKNNFLGYERVATYDVYDRFETTEQDISKVENIYKNFSKFPIPNLILITKGNR